MKKLKIILIFFLLLYSSNMIFLSQGSVDFNDDNEISDIQIVEAFYADLDNQGLPNDILSHFIIEFEDDDNYSFIILFISLTLPSGTQFQYSYLIITDLPGIYVSLYFYNHASESGWYNLKISALLLGSKSHWISDSLTFDPPGGDPGEVPPSTELVIDDLTLY
ncbi:MAG: hypothetical protein ACTSPV_03035 [Candidatus Hodarchaeales archaeon]